MLVDFSKYKNIEGASNYFKKLLKEFHPDLPNSDYSVEELNEITANIISKFEEFKSNLHLANKKQRKTAQKRSVRQKMTKFKNDFNSMPNESKEKVYNMIDNAFSFAGDLVKQSLNK